MQFYALTQLPLDGVSLHFALYSFSTCHLIDVTICQYLTTIYLKALLHSLLYLRFNCWNFTQNRICTPHIFATNEWIFARDCLLIKNTLLEQQCTLSAVYRLPLEGFPCNSIFGHNRQFISNMLVWLMAVSYCNVAVWPAVAGSTKCILMFLCVTWHRHLYIWLLYLLMAM